MRKIIAAFVSIMLFVSGAALGEGMLTVTHENFTTVGDEYSVTGYLYARIENTGDAPVNVSEGTLLIYDAAGNVIDMNEYSSPVPYYAVLQPGQYVYLSDMVFFDEGVAEADVADFEFSIGTDDMYGVEYQFIPCTAALNLDEPNSYSSYVDVTFTNDGAEILREFELVVAIYDAEGNLIYVNTDYGSYVGIHPGSTVTWGVYVSDDLVGEWKENNIVPASADAYVVLYPEDY